MGIDPQDALLIEAKNHHIVWKNAEAFVRAVILMKNKLAWCAGAKNGITLSNQTKISHQHTYKKSERRDGCDAFGYFREFKI